VDLISGLEWAANPALPSAGLTDASTDLALTREAYKELIEGKKFSGGNGSLEKKAQVDGAANGLLLDLQNRTQPGSFGAEEI
jgi:hypothetical protein